ncbi:MAG: response regulator [Aestuariibacter sp.]
MECKNNVEKQVELLLVEDDDVDAIAVKRAFKKQKLQNPIVRAKDGLDALCYLRDKVISNTMIILLDLQMPRMNGIEFLNKIRQDKNLKEAIVFILTTSNAQEDISEAYQANVAGYITKNNVGENFEKLTRMLDGYWQVVHLPHMANER